jgi:hypothetical protein
MDFRIKPHLFQKCRMTSVMQVSRTPCSIFELGILLPSVGEALRREIARGWSRGLPLASMGICGPTVCLELNWGRNYHRYWIAIWSVCEMILWNIWCTVLA